jgi:hypothetical protein
MSRRSRQLVRRDAAKKTMRKILIAPIPVTPTKPFMPSHVKGLLWVDTLYKATSQIAQVDYVYSHSAGNACQQTLGFWEYLDRVSDRVDYTQLSEEAIGQLYMQYHADPDRAPQSALLPYLKAYETEGWVHPASDRLLEIWTRHYALMGAHDPGVRSITPPKISQDNLIDQLRVRNLCLDMRRLGGAVYLDSTAHGLPLRPIVTEDGRANYLAFLLRDLVPVASDYDEIVLIYDREMTPDYMLVQRVLEEFGGSVLKIPLDRVAMNGIVKSSRHGGWEGYTVPEIAAACQAETDLPGFQLGLRLFYIATIGKGEGKSFDMALLQRCMRRAQKLLKETSERSPQDVASYLRRFTGKHHHVDPYQLTSSLLGRGSQAPMRDLAVMVYS